ncbi:hypothetical protein [Streptomyces sp. WMMB 322]|uniref:hypothetical protein n=1 Tax=Streptomyces sp. WMMB 322 TaxID=1286821 RepID=UPI0006E28F55|nr:hypothetical protein [Streptomyces sp. WMMB 322]SCK28151.1 hypothetical protein H180DRAFT_02193 [Streptomyces sp. WMMB 322]
MSYPSEPPNNPYGNNPYANNPYGQQPQQPQQSYGYPQQPQQGYGYPQQPQGAQPGYGYPQAPPPGGPGAAAGALQGKVNAVRIMMFIVGGLQALFSTGVLIMLAFATSSVNELPNMADARIGIGVGYALFGVFLAHAIIGIVMGISLPKGSNGVRVGGIVWSSFLTLFGLVFLPFGIIWLGLGITCIVLLAQSGPWFSRQQY